MTTGISLGWQEVGRGRGGESFSGRKAEHLPSFPGERARVLLPRRWPLQAVSSEMARTSKV